MNKRKERREYGAKKIKITENIESKAGRSKIIDPMKSVDILVLDSKGYSATVP